MRVSLRRGSVLALVAGVLVTTALWVAGRRVVQEQEHSLLVDRSEEVALVVSSLAEQSAVPLRSLATVARVTSGAAGPFRADARSVLAQPGPLAALDAAGRYAALLRQEGSRFVLSTTEGSGAPAGAAAPSSVAGAARSALAAGPGVPAPRVFAVGGRRVLGLAMAVRDLPGAVVYEQLTLRKGAVMESTAPFGELAIAVYGGPRADASQLIAATTGRIPLGDGAVGRALTLGDATWLVEVAPRGPLVGALAGFAPWALVAAGAVITLAVAALMEVLGRRRDYALSLVRARTAELEDAQEALVRRERLAAIGNMAAAIGHDLRNPLGAVTNALYLIRRRAGDDPVVRRHVAIAEREVVAATTIAADLLELARPRDPVLRPVSLSGVVEEALSVAPPPPGVMVHRTGANRDRHVLADRDQLRQVVLNLLTNAYQAMPEGGRLLLGEKDREGGTACLQVADSGPGMDAGTMAQVFEPFFTLRPKGVGLGLAVCRRIVDAHGGAITVESQAGSGASFTVTLPRVEVAAAAVGSGR